MGFRVCGVTSVRLPDEVNSSYLAVTVLGDSQVAAAALPPEAVGAISGDQ